MVQDATPRALREQDEAKENGGTRQVGFYNIQDGQKGRDGGPYLDHVERQQAEVYRAFREEREPEDLNGTLPPAVGTFTTIARQVPDNPYSNPSMAAAPGLELTVTDKTYRTNKNLADPMQVLDVDYNTEPPEPTGRDIAGNVVPESQSPRVRDSSVPNVTLPLGGGGDK